MRKNQSPTSRRNRSTSSSPERRRKISSDETKSATKHRIKKRGWYACSLHHDLVKDDELEQGGGQDSAIRWRGARGAVAISQSTPCGQNKSMDRSVSHLLQKNLDHFSICACHPCAGAMLIFSVSFQFYRMSPKGRWGWKGEPYKPVRSSLARRCGTKLICVQPGSSSTGPTWRRTGECIPDQALS